MYAHLAAAQLATAMKFEDNSESSSSRGGITSGGAVPVPLMPKLKKNVATSMFFCWNITIWLFFLWFDQNKKNYSTLDFFLPKQQN